MLRRRLNSPETTSVGRLFDAVSALVGLRRGAGFEGQAAMALEFIADPREEGAYHLPLGAGAPAVLDWGPLLRELLGDLDRGVETARLSARFHNALADAAVEIARRAGLPRVVLSGGCFQNAYLARVVPKKLCAAGFEVFIGQKFPPNDGALSLGQLWVASLIR
jgi:hydrogenase maturation protein HypF